MSIMHFEVSKDMTPTKIKNAAKARLQELFIEFLKNEFGDENVAMIQTGTATSPKREIGFICGDVKLENGEIVHLVASDNPTCKEFNEHKTDKGKFVPAFDFGAASDAYAAWAAGKAEKEAEKEANKAKNAK